MVELLTGLLVGIVVYTVVAMALQARGYLPEYVSLSGPITTIHTKRGRRFLDRLARHERFWRAWGNVGIGIVVVVMVLSGVFVVFSMWLIIQQPDGAAIESPQNVLVIPGVNDFLPLSAAVEIIFGLLVGLVVHEGGHGLLCRVENIDIDSMGVALFAFVPLGAFVEPDPDDQEQADRGSQTRMFAAGITNNFAVTLVSLGLLVVLVSFISVTAGAPIGDTLPGSAAADAGIERGDVVTAIDGTAVTNSSELERVVADTENRTVRVSRDDGDDVVVERHLLVTGAIPELVSGISLGGQQQPRIRAVNGTSVRTETEFARVVENRTLATIETDRGNATLPVGAYVFHVESDGPLDTAGAPAGGDLILTRVGDTRVTSTSGYEDAVDRLEVGDDVTVVAYVDGERREFAVTAGGHDNNPGLGVRTEDGYSGLLLDDFGVDTYPAGGFLAMLGGNALPSGVSGLSGFMFYQLQLLILPFATLVMEGISYNFAGFTSGVASFYTVEGPLSVAGGGVLVATNLLFWTWWINFNLAVFNCIPAFPLDGGHILRSGTESIVSRLPTDHGRSIVTLVTVSITLTMAAALVVLVFGPLWLT